MRACASELDINMTEAVSSEQREKVSYLESFD